MSDDASPENHIHLFLSGAVEAFRTYVRRSIQESLHISIMYDFQHTTHLHPSYTSSLSYRYLYLVHPNQLAGEGGASPVAQIVGSVPMTKSNWPPLAKTSSQVIHALSQL